MRSKIIAGVVASAALLATSVAQPAEAKKGPPVEDPVFADGGVMAGSTNGISFAPDGTLWVANVLGDTITQIDADSGDVLSRLTPANGVFFPDDVIVGSDYTIYWTNIALGMVMKMSLDETGQPDGPPVALVGFFGLNSANPLTLNDEEDRLWAAGCYGGDPGNSFVEVDLNGAGIINVLRENIPGCASNGMSWHDGFLYSPQPFTDEILRLDPEAGADQIPEVITSGFSVPIGTAFDSNGVLHSLAQGVGEVVTVDILNPGPNNRTVIAEIPVGWADNIAINDDDRIFISSASDSSIVEVMPGGVLRTVVPGQFELPGGVAVIGNTLYTANLGQVIGWNRKTRERTSIFRAAFGATQFPPTTSVIAWGENLLVMSALSGQVMIWDPVTNTPVAQNLLVSPTDAQPFDGGLLVTQGTPTGEIVRMSADLSATEVIASVQGATGLAARGGDVYVSDNDSGTVLRIIGGGEVLPTPVEVFSGLSAPEGIDIKGNTMYVVEAGSQTLTSINMKTGARATIATELGLQVPTLFPIGWFNDVTVAGKDIYVNADRRNVIYEF